MTHAQVLRKKTSLELIKSGVDYVYNFQFDSAHQVYHKLKNAYPGHPVIFLFKGMITYWENYPLLPSSPASLIYENDMHFCIELCQKSKNQVDEAEYLLTKLCAMGMLLLFYSDNDLSKNVIPLASGTYQFVRQSFDYTSVYTDFYFFTGLYNYYREAYPKVYPMYKTLAFIFPKGEMSKGILELQKAAFHSIFLKAESYSFLSWISTNFENDFQEAANYSKTLHELFPANINYTAAHIKNLLLIKHYDEAEKLMRSSGIESNNSFYRAQLAVFNGILQEKKYLNRSLAKKYYENGISNIVTFYDYGNEYAAYAYFGLSRIIENDADNKKKNYRKMAMELSEFNRDIFS
jgi:hypothetical protein